MFAPSTARQPEILARNWVNFPQPIPIASPHHSENPERYLLANQLQ
jgi:hypothetical protein